jgi:anti-sigma B factor antagonist
MSPLAQLNTRTDNGNAVIACVVGEVDISNAADIGSALEGSVPQRVLGLILDLSETTYMDSAGVHLLFRLGGRLTRRRQQLRVVVPETARIRKVVNLAGLAWTVPQDLSVADALTNLRAEVAPQLGEESWVGGPNAPVYY